MIILIILCSEQFSAVFNEFDKKRNIEGVEARIRPGPIIY